MDTDTMSIEAKQSSHGDAVPDQDLYIDPIKEKKLLRKLDIWIAPIMTIIFLTAYLDRSNIGNAASAGMVEDIGMTDGELGNAVTLFYVTYVAAEIPCSLVMKKFHPGRMIPFLMFCWSVVLIGTGFMHNTGQLYASRLLLGLCESGMFPCLALYLSTFYQPREQALRVSYLFVSAALSGSFGGLFAYALIKMDGIAGLEGWRWLFIIEGCGSVVISIIVFFLLPDNYETARFLNEEERQLMRTRAQINARYNGKPDFDWAQVRKAALDPKLYISCWSQFMADLCSFGLSSFLPLIIKSFGYDTVTTQLLTIPVFFWASFAYIVVSWMSDRWQRRAFFMMPACLVTAIGYGVNLGVPMNEKGVLYFSTFLIAPGVYMIVGLNCTWLLNSHAPYYKRAMAIGMNQSIGNSAGVVVGQIFKTKRDGKYLIGLSSSLAAVMLASLGHISLYLYLRRQNRTREAMTEEQREREIQMGKAGDFHPDYRGEFVITVAGFIATSSRVMASVVFILVDTKRLNTSQSCKPKDLSSASVLSEILTVAMSEGTITFFDLASKPPGTAWSLNPWKTRLLLNYKGLKYKTEWLEYPDIKPTFEGHVPPNPQGKEYTIPGVILEDGTWCQDSRKIADLIEKAHPEPPVHLDSPYQAKIEGLIGKVTVPMLPVVFPQIPRTILGERSVGYWVEDRAKILGGPLDQVERERGGDAAYTNATPALKEVTALLQENQDGPFFSGKTLVYADFVWIGFLIFIKRVNEDIYEELVKRSGDRTVHDKLMEAAAPWLARNDH